MSELKRKLKKNGNEKDFLNLTTVPVYDCALSNHCHDTNEAALDHKKLAIAKFLVLQLFEYYW